MTTWHENHLRKTLEKNTDGMGRGELMGLEIELWELRNDDRLSGDDRKACSLKMLSVQQSLEVA